MLRSMPRRTRSERSSSVSALLKYQRLTKLSEERNRADSTIHDIETKLDEYKDQLDSDEVKQLKEDAERVSRL